jgi:hypothetical protein
MRVWQASQEAGLIFHKSSSNAPLFIGFSVSVTALSNGTQEGVFGG